MCRLFILILFAMSAGCGNVNLQSDTISRFESVAFVPPSSVWLITGDNLIHTEDGGANWTYFPAPAQGTSKITFINPKQGWLVNGSGHVFRTQDGGKNWVQVATLLNKDSRFYTPLQIYFTDELSGWVLETYSVWQTIDGGVNWKLLVDVNGPRKPYRTSFVNSKNGWICSVEDEALYVTSDGGDHWKRKTFSFDSTCRNLFFVKPKLGWLSAWPNGGIYRTDDGGESLKLQFAANKGEEVGIDSLYFTDENTGWAVGRIWPSRQDLGRKPTQGIILRTVDGGRIWERIETGLNDSLFSQVYFSGNKIGWLIGYENVYHTEDGGNTWQSLLHLPR